jgi:hypothetical protein
MSPPHTSGKPKIHSQKRAMRDTAAVLVRRFCHVPGDDRVRSEGVVAVQSLLKIDLIGKVDERISCRPDPFWSIRSGDEIGILFQRLRQNLPISSACRDEENDSNRRPAESLFEDKQHR